jgi:anthranilate synthase component 1
MHLHAGAGFGVRTSSVELPGDLLTPFGVFCLLDLQNVSSHGPRGRGDAFLFEGALGRYSYVGAGFGAGRFTVRGGRVIREEGGPLPSLQARGRERAGKPPGSGDSLDGKPLEALRALLGSIAAPPTPGLPPFTGGFAGYLGWGAARFSEELPQRLGPDPLFPEADLLWVRELVAFDHRMGRCWAIATGDGKGDDSPEVRAAKLAERVLRVFGGGGSLLGQEAKRSRGLDIPAALQAPAAHARPAEGKALEKLLSPMGGGRAAYEKSVERGLEYIRAGDVFQVVLSQRFELPDVDGFTLYRTLRAASPAPYHFYLRLGGRELFGASPELLVQVERGAVTVRPIAGTRRRGATQAEDEAFERELRGDPKENAEHVMLVDLGRNDVGRVAEIGSVRVARLKEIERFSHVMHLTSEVTGKLRSGLGPVDAFSAAFPAGTLSGAPKLRALEIIDELESVPRGPYGGAVGWFSAAGDAQLAIAIRTLFRAQGRLFAHAGAGIVADSVPAEEWREVQAKIRASVTAASGAFDQSAAAQAEAGPGGLR